MKVSNNRNIDIGNEKVNVKLHRRPVSLLVKQGANDTHDTRQRSTINDTKNDNCTNNDINDVLHDEPIEYDVPDNNDNDTNVDAVDVPRIVIVSTRGQTNKDSRKANIATKTGSHENSDKINRNDNAAAYCDNLKITKHAAAVHAHRFGCAAFACSIAWTACSAMGANYGIINQSTGIASAATATAIAIYQITRKVRNR